MTQLKKINSQNETKPDIRERAFSNGMNYPTDEELIMLIIGSGTKKYSVEHLSEKILKVVDVSPTKDLAKNLLKIDGVGKYKALAISAAVEFGRRKTCHLEARVRAPSDVIPYVQAYAMKPKEHFITVLLSGAHEILNIGVSFVGTVNKTVIHPREIFCDAIKQNAAAIIVCHNHPSGNCQPSEEDISATRLLYESSRIIGIPLLDHIIINQTSYFSFMENRIFEEFSPYPLNFNVPNE